MKLTRNSYDNEVFSSLLDGINQNYVIQKKASDNVEPSTANVEETQFFTKTTADNMTPIYEREIENIAQEMAFATDRSNVTISDDDFARFAKLAISSKWQGKTLQREARKFCNEVGKTNFEPIGSQKMSAEDWLSTMSPHKIVSTASNPDVPAGQNNSATGRYLGCSRNPNSIWDTDALVRQASIALGDEKIAASQREKQEQAENLKKQQWEGVQKEAEAGLQVRNRIVNAGNSVDQTDSYKPVAPNAMSIFGDNAEFDNLPDRTIGEKIAEAGAERAAKKANSRSDWDKCTAPTNTRSSLDYLFNGFTG